MQLGFGISPNENNIFMPLSQWELDNRSNKTDVGASVSLPYFVGSHLGKSVTPQRLNLNRLGHKIIKSSDGSAILLSTSQRFDLSAGKIGVLIFPRELIAIVSTSVWLMIKAPHHPVPLK